MCFLFFSKVKGQGVAGERMREDQGIKSSTHRDDCALPGTVVVIKFHCKNIIASLSLAT